MAFLMFLSVFTILCLYIYKLVTPSAKHWRYGNKIPGPKPLPILGNGVEFLMTNNILQKLLELSYTYGRIYRLWLGKQLFVMLSDPRDVEVFLSSSTHLNKSDTYRLLDTWLGNKGLLTSDADVWRPHRKVLTPSFHFKMLQNILPMITNNALILCQELQSKINQSEFDIQCAIEKCSFDVICETAMGTKMNMQISNNIDYPESLKRICSSVVTRVFRPWLFPEFLFKLSNAGKTYYEMLPIIKNYNKQVIMKRKISLQKGRVDMPEGNAVDDEEKKMLKPFLDILLTESNFTDEEIEDEVHNFMFAGHDTTTTAMSFCLFALSQNQRVQDKLFEEIKNVLLDPKTQPTYQDYMNMKYLDNVLKESLRMYSPVPAIARKVDEDVKLPSGNIIPAGSLVNFFLLRMHNDEELFSNPELFIPERFENCEKHPFSYIPFSAGPRNCVGQKFAMLEMKIVLSTLLSKYQFLPSTTVKSLTLSLGVVLCSLEKKLLRIIPRDF